MDSRASLAIEFNFPNLKVFFQCFIFCPTANVTKFGSLARVMVPVFFTIVNFFAFELKCEILTIIISMS